MTDEQLENRTRESLMTHFSVGEQVIVRFGKHQGQMAKIIKRPQANVFQVKVEDGFILFFSGKGLEKQVETGQRTNP